MSKILNTCSVPCLAADQQFIASQRPTAHVHSSSISHQRTRKDIDAGWTPKVEPVLRSAEVDDVSVGAKGRP